MKLLIPWTIAFFCGCIAYLACGGRLRVERCDVGPVCSGDFCCPAGYECADGGCAPVPHPESTTPPEPALSTDPAPGGAATAGPIPTPRGQ